MIRVYTKNRHIQKIKEFFDTQNIECSFFTIKDESTTNDFDLGISYCYPRKITEPLLSLPSKGFINYHPGPLPEYKGPDQYRNAIMNKEKEWGVTVHFMDEEYDSGPIIKVNRFQLHEPPSTIEELGSITHYFLFKLFKQTIVDIYQGKLK